MDAQRIADITAALSDLLGADVTRWRDRWWGWREYYIEDDGTIDTDGSSIILPEDLDLLHAASQIVRRMNHA